jgi:hypothetical protein
LELQWQPPTPLRAFPPFALFARDSGNGPNADPLRFARIYTKINQEDEMAAKSGIVFAIVFLLLSGFAQAQVDFDNYATASYREILALGIKPRIAPGYFFPLSKQHHNGCYGFSMKHIVDYKFKVKIDVDKAEKKIGKPRNDLWTNEHITNFNALVGIRLTWEDRACDLFRRLVSGDPVMIQYKYALPGNSWVGHFVAAYSFDKTGLWVSESISNKRKRIPYKDIFGESGTSTFWSFASVGRT